MGAFVYRFGHQVLPSLLFQDLSLVAAHFVTENGAGRCESPASPVPETIG
jgi:hypothetical protein